MRTFLRSLLAGLVILTVPSAVQAATRVTYQAGSEQQVLLLLNQIRHQHGLGSLSLSAPLRSAARGHSADMLVNSYFDHDSPGEAWNLRIARYVKSPMMGEDIAHGIGLGASPGRIVSQWMQSPGHRRTILTPGFRLVGLGIAVGTWQGLRGSVMATADFAA